MRRAPPARSSHPRKLRAWSRRKYYEQRLTLIDANRPNRNNGSTQADHSRRHLRIRIRLVARQRRIAYTAAKGNGDNNWWIAQLYTVRASGEITAFYKPATADRESALVARRKQIAFIGGLMSDEGSTGGDIFAVPARAGAPHDLTPDRQSSPSWLRWLPSGKILFTETVNGGSAHRCRSIRQRDGAETLWSGDETLRAGDDAVVHFRRRQDGGSVRSSWTLAPEVWAGPVERMERSCTHANDALKPLWGKTRESPLDAATIRSPGLADVSGAITIRRRSIRWWSRCTAARRRRKNLLAQCVRYDVAFEPGLFRVLSESARQLRRGRRRSRKANVKDSARAICATFCSE